MTRKEFLNVALLQATEEGVGIHLAKFADLCIEWATNEAIDKACEWLYEYNRKQADKMFGTVHTADVTINVAEFRKAMESSSSEKPNNSKEGEQQ